MKRGAHARAEGVNGGQGSADDDTVRCQEGHEVGDAESQECPRLADRLLDLLMGFQVRCLLFPVEPVRLVELPALCFGLLFLQLASQVPVLYLPQTVVDIPVPKICNVRQLVHALGQPVYFLKLHSARYSFLRSVTICSSS